MVTPPRYFWRRAVAFLVDYCLAGLVALVLLLPFLGNTDRIRLGDGVISMTKCQSLATITQSIADVIGPKLPDSADLCDAWYDGIYDGKSVTSTYGSLQPGKSGTQWVVTVAVNDKGQVVNPAHPHPDLMAFLLWIGAALMIARFGFSPGKWLLGLRIVGVDRPVSGARAVAHEGLKLAPILLGTVVVSIGEFWDRRTQISTARWLFDHWVRLASAGVLFAILLIILYVVPLIRWRGAMFYDRRLGLVVTGPQKRKKAPPGLPFDGR